MKLVMKGQFKKIDIQNQAKLQMEFPMSEVSNYVQAVRLIGGTPGKLLIKYDTEDGEVKAKLGTIIGRQLNIDLRDGDAVLTMEGDPQDMSLEKLDIPRLKEKIIAVCIITEGED